MNVRIRAARPADAEALTALAERTFRDTFAHDNSTRDMDAYVSAAFSLAAVHDELADPANTFLIACDSIASQPVGYAKLRTGTVDPNVTGPNPIELQRLYVDRRSIGHGVGAALMDASIGTARAAGYRTLWLGVWEHNARAIAFYTRWRFRHTGDHVFRLGADDQTDLIMVRTVVEPA